MTSMHLRQWFQPWENQDNHCNRYFKIIFKSPFRPLQPASAAILSPFYQTRAQAPQIVPAKPKKNNFQGKSQIFRTKPIKHFQDKTPLWTISSTLSTYKYVPQKYHFLGQKWVSLALFSILSAQNIIIAHPTWFYPSLGMKNTITDGGVAPQCTFARPI